MSSLLLTETPTLHRPPSPLYKELARKARIHQGIEGILEIDYNTGLFGIEFTTGGLLNLDTELARTSKRFPLAGVERFQVAQPSDGNDGRKVFYFDSSGVLARGSGMLTFSQTATGHKRVSLTKIRLEVE